ncbi:MAG TPA: hypothetical protein VMI52_04000 [Acetobacteraceae bacterium]|nr:hypothetical protein [Acetobacteraceae bacterium]
MNHSYAVLCKTFFQNRFVARRLRDLSARATGGDFYVIHDSTRQCAQFGPDTRVVHARETDLIEAGFANYPAGNLFWYNADYPLYRFFDRYPDYDYYVMVEFDAVATRGLDTLVRQAAAEGTDFIGQPIDTPVGEWKWLESCDGLYARHEVKPYLLCVSLFSHRAVRLLRDRRLELSRAYRARQTTSWPIAEAFVGTELHRDGMAVRHLDAYGRLGRYDVWPPYHELQLSGLSGQLFIHPVLNGKRYWRGLLRNGLFPALRAWGDMALGRERSYEPWTARRLSPARSASMATRIPFRSGANQA